MSNAVSALESHLGFWLRLVSNHVSHGFAARVAAKGVTVAEWVVLRSLHGRAPMAPSEIAAALNMTRGAISKLADRLIAKSLIAREESAQDGRAHTLALTAHGKRLVPQLAALADRNDAAFFGVLTAGERRSLDKILKRLAAHGRMTALPVD